MRETQFLTNFSLLNSGSVTMVTAVIYLKRTRCWQDTEELEAGIICDWSTSGSDNKTATSWSREPNPGEKGSPKLQNLTDGHNILNLIYPKELKCTFEVFQKLFLGLDGLKVGAKV